MVSQLFCSWEKNSCWKNSFPFLNNYSSCSKNYFSVSIIEINFAIIEINSPLCTYIVCFLESLNHIKEQFFTGDIKNGYEPSCGVMSVTDGTLFSIGHLFAASICNGGPAPTFLSLWIYKFIISGIQAAKQCLPTSLGNGHLYNDLYEKVSYNFNWISAHFGTHLKRMLSRRWIYHGCTVQ